MIKTMMSLFLALLLSAFLCAAAYGEVPESIPGTVVIHDAGFRFVPPESFRDTAGAVVMDSSLEIRDGIFFSGWMYYAMTEEERDAYLNSHDPDAPAEYRIIPLFYVISIANGMTFGSFNALCQNAFQEEYVRELGKLGDTTYCLYMEGPNRDFINAIDPAYKDEYIALASTGDELTAAFTFFEAEKEPDPYKSLIGSRFEFTTTDLDGNPVSSEKLFAQNDITVINIWTTWCGPCIGELSQLQELHARLQANGCGVVGMLADADLEAACGLIEENGLTYPVILAPDALNAFLVLEYVPTTLFVGRDGSVLAAPVIGAYVEEYETVADALMDRK